MLMNFPIILLSKMLKTQLKTKMRKDKKKFWMVKFKFKLEHYIKTKVIESENYINFVNEVKKKLSNIISKKNKNVCSMKNIKK